VARGGSGETTQQTLATHDPARLKGGVRWRARWTYDFRSAYADMANRVVVPLIRDADVEDAMSLLKEELASRGARPMRPRTEKKIRKTLQRMADWFDRDSSNSTDSP
jgi:hypothetical protein